MSKPHAEIALSEVLAGLSTALDLTEGQPAGHAVRTCVIGCRLADELGLSASDRSALYYTLLLKDAGCSSNAARFAALFGTHDQVAKHEMKLVDRHHFVRLTVQVIKTAARGGSLAEKLRHVFGIATGKDLSKELFQIRCDRGADIVSQMGFPAETAEAIRALDEHWCGAGYPNGLRGDAIPLLARIANLAQNVELFYNEAGVGAALDVVRARRGTWFDPALSDLVLGWRGDAAWWRSLEDPALHSVVAAMEPHGHVRRVDDTGLDLVARGFADIVDAKSPHTFRHSSNVAEYARGIGRVSGFGAETQHRLYRAGLLHDVGKLGVSNRILDSSARLSLQQRYEVERHPEFTWRILRGVGAFRDFSWLAATHHEKLDGSGYPWGLHAEELDQPARILVVADIYEALTAHRPYRERMSHGAAISIMMRDRKTKLCANAIDALVDWAERARRAAGEPLLSGAAVA